MGKRPNLVFSMLQNKCPQCRKGDLFLEKNPYKLKTMFSMPDTCPECGFTNNPEPGFYWGAMYASYAISVGMSIVLFAIIFYFWGWRLPEFIISDTLLLFGLFPITARYARVMWLYIVIRYKGDQSED
jgi:hypothetical protein